jgi:REP element-mobilizing transposase RayT
MSTIAWNNWFHVTSHTYGTWLPGDPRGWRTRHHRVDAPGDYRHAPLPLEQTQGLHEQARRAMTRPAVHLSTISQKVVISSMREACASQDVDLAAICVDDHHVHALIRCTNQDPRLVFGIAKKDSARRLSTAGLVAPGGTWGVRSHITPIVDREHQVVCVNYIVGHGSRGATIWWIGMDKRQG